MLQRSEAHENDILAGLLIGYAFVLPQRLHQALIGMDRQQYREAHPDVLVSMACVALIVLGAMLMVAFRNAERRHIGDYLARTVVVSRKSESSSSNQPSP